MLMKEETELPTSIIANVPVTYLSSLEFAVKIGKLEDYIFILTLLIINYCINY